MKINIDIQNNYDHTLPLLPTRTWSGSSLPVEICGVPYTIGGDMVTGITIIVTNADGEPYTCACEYVGGKWCTVIGSAAFTTYGFIELGIKVKAMVKNASGTIIPVTIAAGDFEVVKSDATAQPGSGGGGTSGNYQTRGGDLYLKTQIVDGIQHYTKQVMEYDPDIGWGASWTGDYIKDDEGNFTEFTE